MFLRVMDSIDEIVVSPELVRSPTEIARNTRLKDAMRSLALPRVVNVWLALLSDSGGATGPDEAGLKAHTLVVVARYIPWIDIGFFASDQFISSMVQYLGVEQHQRKVRSLFFFSLFLSHHSTIRL